MREATNHWAAGAKCIHIGLVNNMPDSALEATERQFRALLCEAESAEGIAVRLSLFAIPEIPRSEKARCRIDSSYLSLNELWDNRLDGLVVTGAEPGARKLTEEPYWASLANLIDWAEHNAYSSVWSCLAAHAAVLRMHGIERRRFGDKLFGVFECAKRSDHPLTAGVPARFQIPHSRWNDIPEDVLSACGYRILTQLENGSVDVFVRQTKNLFVFFQGHPEYNADSLLLEYRRDIRRFLNRERELYPSMPQGYFDGDATAAFTSVRARAVADRREQSLANFNPLIQSPNVRNTWHPDAVRFYRNWLRYLFEQKNMRSESRSRPIQYELNTAAAVIAAGAGPLVQEVEA
ncbi:MAG: homoserine O-succinyltransferase [Acidobacteriaceae bacterium]|nr:homoserine O-succinyltransferase [Acidobacteriaceae bacterium]